MIFRKILPTFERYMNSFPAVLVTGARQVGKTTLAKSVLVMALDESLQTTVKG